MSVKRYDLVGDMDGNCNLNEARMELSDDGVYVKYSEHSLLEQKLTDMVVQLANAESKCRELTAENAALKSTCDDRRTFIMNGVQLGYIKVPTVDTDPALDTIRVAVSPQAPTTATDAFLAEVRVQGVEMFANAQNKIADDEESKGNIDLSLRYRGMSLAAGRFASQIRKGASL